MDYLVLIASPYLWWLYVILAFFLYFAFTTLNHRGKDIHLILQKESAGWVELGRYWVSPIKKWFRTRSKKTFITDPGDKVYTANDFAGGHRVFAHDYAKARPRQVEWDDEKKVVIDSQTKKPAEKTTKKATIKRTRGKEEWEDPSSEEMDIYLAQEAWGQTVRANKHGGMPGKEILVMMIAISVVVGILCYVVGAYVQPHYIYQAAQGVTNSTSFASATTHTVETTTLP